MSDWKKGKWDEQLSLDKCDWEKLSKWVESVNFADWNIHEGFDHRFVEEVQKQLLKYYKENNPKHNKEIEKLERSISLLDFFNIEDELGISFRLVNGRWKLTNVYDYEGP
ncbi:MAG: hypothetical protein Fur0010_22310 [Bdellovibrio sp.]